MRFSKWPGCLVVLCSLSLCSAALAQSGKGAIFGRVADETGALLQGAEVRLQPVGVSVASDQQGEFTITNLPAGTYTLSVSYVGFKVSQSTVVVETTETHRLTVRMDVEGQREEVLVTGERPHGEAEAINRTRTADNILQVLPAEVITSLPNANVADALGRLPSVTLARDEGEGVYVQVRGTEPRLTNVTINGITVPSPEPTVRQVRLDAVAADLVESVEINKTLSANQDGDGIGGSVNLRTKTATEQPTLILSMLGGYNPILGGRGNDQFGLTIGKRFGADKRLGVLVGLAYDWNGRGIDDVEPGISATASTMAAPFYDNNTVREYRYTRTRSGFTGSGDYKLGQASLIRVAGIMSSLKDYGDKWYYSPAAAAAPKFYTSSKSPEYSIGSVDVSGKHLLSASWLTWDVAAAHASQSHSAGNPKADFSWLGPTLNCGFNPAAQTDAYVPTFGSGCDAAGTPLQNASNWGLKDLTTSDGSTSQLNLSVAGSAGLNYRAGTHPATLEFGAKFRNGHKSQDATEIVYDGWKAASYPMTGLLNPFSSSNYYNDSYYGGHYGPVSNFNSVVNLVQTQLSNFVNGYKTAAATYPNIFDLTERIGAAYVMNTVDFNKLRLQAGLRFETTRMETNGYDVTLYPAGSKNCPTPTGCGVPIPVSNNPSYVDALPSVQAKYAITSDSNLRAAYGRGLSRPDTYQLVPYATQDDSTNPATVSIGNPALQPSHANNYDLLFEQFLRPAGMIQAGVFYKQLSDPLVLTNYTPTTGNNAGQLVTQWLNGSSADIHGVEVSYQQHLTALPGALAGLGVFANYSHTASSVENLPGRSDSPALQRQTPNSWNLSPTYDRGRASIRLGLTYNGPAIYQYAYQTSSDPAHLGPGGPAGDQYTYKHLQVDAQGSVSLSRGLKATIYMLNLSDEPYGLYVGSEQFVRQREYDKTTFGFGLRYIF